MSTSVSVVAATLLCCTVIACSSATMTSSASDNHESAAPCGCDAGAAPPELHGSTQDGQAPAIAQGPLAAEARGPFSRATGTTRPIFTPITPAPFVPVMVFHGVCATVCAPDDIYSVTAADLATFLAAMNDRGFSTITSQTYVRAMHGDVTGLPARPVLLTFDDGRLDTYTGADPLLRAAHATATMFVITSRPDSHASGFVSWADVVDAQRSGTWDVQLHASSGHVQIPVGIVSDVAVTGAFFANRQFDATAYASEVGNLEPHALWKERAENDLALGMAALRAHLDDYVPSAFAVPYSDYGQSTSNDPLIAPELRVMFDTAFPVWFTQSSPTARTGTHERARFAVHSTTTVESMLTWITNVPATAQQ